MRILLVFFLFAFSAGCENLMKPVDNQPIDMRDDRGTAIGSLGMLWAGNSLVWSKATNEVFCVDYPLGGALSIKGINVSTQATRIVSSIGDPHLHYEDRDMQLSSDGSTLFYTLSGSSLHETSVLENRDMTIATGVTSFAISGDTRYVAYSLDAYPSISGITYLYDHRTNSGRYLCEGMPCVFSPTADRLLICRDSVYAIVNILDGSIQSLGVPPNSPRAPMNLYNKYIWDQSGLRSLTGGGFLVLSLNPYSVLSFAGVPGSIYGPHAWSPDGKKVIVWTHDCLKHVSTGLLSEYCAAYESSVYAMDVSSRTVSKVSFTRTASGNEFPIAVTFSPDGLKIAYIYGRTIYVKEL